MTKSFPKGTLVVTPDGEGISDGQIYVNGSHLIYVKYKHKINIPIGKHYQNGTYEYFSKDVEILEKDE
jgi:hypothetical protein